MSREAFQICGGNDSPTPKIRVLARLAALPQKVTFPTILGTCNCNATTSLFLPYTETQRLVDKISLVSIADTIP